MFARTSFRRHFRLTLQPGANIAAFILDCTQYGPGAVVLTDLSFWGGSADGTIASSGKEYSTGQLNVAGTDWSGSENSAPYAPATLGIDPANAEVDYSLFGGVPIVGLEVSNPSGIVQVIVCDLAIQINRLSDFIPGV